LSKESSMRRQGILVVVAGTTVAVLMGCHPVEVSHHDDGGGNGSGAAGSSGAAGTGGLDGGGADSGAVRLPPTAFTMTEMGGYKLGEAIVGDDTGTATSGQKVCNTIAGVVRDFKGALAAAGGTAELGGHPDFEVFEGRGPTLGLVAADLGPDHKPVYASHCEVGAPVSQTCPFGAMTSSKANFDQWYRSTDRVNKPYLVYFLVGPATRGVSTFLSNHFFPLDGAGWGNSGKDLQNVPHNFGFTTEIHTTFRYQGGESFTFTGDDDVWVFVNGKLAVDLGGLHRVAVGVVDLDQAAGTLGIIKGTIYALDLFHAERHSVDSNFRIDMNFVFEDCGYVVP
jgi:fibro-slime domain-containing protein